MQAYGAEDHSYVHSGIHPLVSLDLHHHVLVHMFQIPERFGYQVLVLAIKESCGLLNQIGVLVVSSKISLTGLYVDLSSFIIGKIFVSTKIMSSLGSILLQVDVPYNYQVD